MSSGRPMRSRRVRHYALVRGRTRGQRVVTGETVVSVPSGSDLSDFELSPECRQLWQRVRTPVSVARLSAELNLPLGVVRVLLCDLADKEAVSLHDEYRYDRDVLERVLSGLEGLSA